MRTSLTILNASYDITAGLVYVEIKNDGRTVLSDYPYWDVYITALSAPVTWYSYTPDDLADTKWKINSISLDTGAQEILNINRLDPDEIMNISIQCPILSGRPLAVQICTYNGAGTAAYIK